MEDRIEELLGMLLYLTIILALRLCSFPLFSNLPSLVFHAYIFQSARWYVFLLNFFFMKVTLKNHINILFQIF